MLSEQQLEIITEALIPLFQYLEKEVIVDIARQIQKTLAYSRTAELQAMSMKELGYSPARIRKEAMKILNADPKYRKMVAKNTLEYKREVSNIINQIKNQACKANDEILASAGNMAWMNDLSVWKDAGKRLTDNSYLSQLVESFAMQTAGELKNMTGTTGFKTMSGYESIEQVYKRELDKAVIKICSGTFSQEKVLRDVVHNLAQSGLRSIDFASGYSMQLDTAVRGAIRTGCHQLAGKITDKNIEKTGENLVYVSKHWGARNTGTGHANHEKWQGRVYYIKPGKDYTEEAKRIGQDYIMDLWYATGYSVDGAHKNDPLGLDGYNCRHRRHPWFEGVSTFPPEDEQPKPVTINGKTYDYYAITQKMRAKERAIRALKREKEALKALGIDATEIQAKISRKTAEYKAFCKMCNVPEKTSRLRYECGTSDLKKTKAWKEYKEQYSAHSISNPNYKFNEKADFGIKLSGVSQEVCDRIQLLCKNITRKGSETGKEYAYAIDKIEGKEIAYEEGNVGECMSVEFLTEISKWENDSVIIMHNHTDNRGASYFDVNISLTEKVVYASIMSCNNGDMHYISARKKKFDESSVFDLVFDVDETAVQEELKKLPEYDIIKENQGSLSSAREEIIAKIIANEYFAEVK